MSPLTDDRIAELVRDAFVAHEDLADPLQFRLPDEQPQRRTGPFLVTFLAAAAVVIAGVLVLGSRSGTTPSPDLGSPPTRPVTDASNRATTVRVARTLLSSVPLLPGGRALDRAPVRRLVARTETINWSSTNTIDLTRWWTGDQTVRGALSYYLHHHPAGLVAQSGASYAGARTVQYSAVTPDPAYTSRYLLLTIVKDGRGVAVRGDTFVNWRPARTGSSLVGENVQAIDATVRMARELGDPPHPIHHGRITDPQQIQRVLRQVNGYYGAAPLETRCPPPAGPAFSYVLRFRTGFGPTEMVGTTGCTGSVQLLRRGQTAGPALDATVAFARLVRRLAH